MLNSCKIQNQTELLCKRLTTSSFETVLGVNNDIGNIEYISYEKGDNNIDFDNVLKNIYSKKTDLVQTINLPKCDAILTSDYNFENVVQLDLRDTNLIEKIGVKQLKYTILLHRKQIILFKFMIIQLMYYHELLLNTFLEQPDVDVNMIFADNIEYFNNLIQFVGDLDVKIINDSLIAMTFLQKKYQDTLIEHRL